MQNSPQARQSLTIPGGESPRSPPKPASQFRLGSTPTQRLPDTLDRVFRHMRFFKIQPKEEKEGGGVRSFSLMRRSLWNCAHLPPSLQKAPVTLHECPWPRRCGAGPPRSSAGASRQLPTERSRQTPISSNEYRPACQTLFLGLKVNNKNKTNQQKVGRKQGFHGRIVWGNTDLHWLIYLRTSKGF